MVIDTRVGTCVPCHGEAMSGADPKECGTCHEAPDHEVLTSQGVSVAHEELPWIEDRCVRCHYDVSVPTNRADRIRCYACHEVLPTGGDDVGLHADHDEYSCTACHERDGHRIRRMSSSVDLACADCHARPHAVEEAWEGAETACDGCHRAVHADQQRMVLGLVDGDVAPVPSEKFLLGLTCRSCHEPTDAATSEVTGACASCHGATYTTVLGWWEDGVAQRVGNVRGFVDRVRGSAGQDASQDLARASALLDFIERGRGVHNLTMTHRLLQRSVGLASAVNATLGPEAPAPPPLGLAPDANACSRCHYNLRFDPTRPGAQRNDAFHRAIPVPRP